MLKPIRLRSRPGSKEMSLDVGTVVCDSQLVEVNHTVLDPKVLKEGADFELGGVYKNHLGDLTDFIRIPPVSADGRMTKTGGMIFVNGISIAANAVVRAINSKEVPHKVQATVDHWYTTLLDKVRGPGGVLARGVAGTRMPNSGRLVAVPAITHGPDWVGLYKEAMKKSGVEVGDFIIICRDPVIWDGSIEVVRCYAIDDPVIAIHPLLYRGLGADADGDTVAFVKPNFDDPGVREECESKLIEHTRREARWPASLCPDDLPEEVDWNDVVADTKRRFKVTGLSYGPIDVCHKNKKGEFSKETLALEKSSGKKFGEKNLLIARATSIDEIWPMILATNDQQLVMKLELGHVGALSRRLLLLADDDSWLAPSASKMSEALQQSKLNAKHDEESLGAAEAADMFEKTGEWIGRTPEDVLTKLEEAGIPSDHARPMVMHVYVEAPMLILAEELGLDESLMVQVRKNIRIVVKDSPHRQAEFEKWLGSKSGKSLKEFKALVKTWNLGVRGICNRWYPGYSFIGRSASLEHYKRAFVDGVKDKGSVFRVVQDAMQVAE